MSLLKRRGTKPPEVPPVVSPVEALEPSPAPMDLSVKTVMVTQDSLKPVVVPAALPVSLPAGLTKVNLKHVVGINGANYGPGKDILVPTDAFQSWRHALADDKE